MKTILTLATIFSAWCASASANEVPQQFIKGREAIQRMAGCFLVDYSYTETEGLLPGYQRDTRVYEVNKARTIKEWIYVDENSPTRIRLQHILFAENLAGKVDAETLLKHTGEDWDFEAPFRYEFVSPLHWEARQQSEKNVWTRRVTGLDDGLRFQCSAPWDLNKANPTWACSAYAPIPGRETRDMGRKDYQAMDRWNSVIVYGNSWLEREENTKMIQDASGKKPLAKELGKNWYVRMPDSDCQAARDYVAPRKEFWKVIREAWDGVFTGQEAFVEKTIAGQPGRYMSIMGLEDKYMAQNLGDRGIRQQAIGEIRGFIELYRQR